MIFEFYLTSSPSSSLGILSPRSTSSPPSVGRCYLCICIGRVCAQDAGNSLLLVSPTISLRQIVSPALSLSSCCLSQCFSSCLPPYSLNTTCDVAHVYLLQTRWASNGLKLHATLTKLSPLLLPLPLLLLPFPPPPAPCVFLFAFAHLPSPPLFPAHRPCPPVLFLILLFSSSCSPCSSSHPSPTLPRLYRRHHPYPPLPSSSSSSPASFRSLILHPLLLVIFLLLVLVLLPLLLWFLLLFIFHPSSSASSSNSPSSSSSSSASSFFLFSSDFSSSHLLYVYRNDSDAGSIDPDIERGTSVPL
jgi:hypothetical protein